MTGRVSGKRPWMHNALHATAHNSPLPSGSPPIPLINFRKYFSESALSFKEGAVDVGVNYYTLSLCGFMICAGGTPLRLLWN